MFINGKKVKEGNMIKYDSGKIQLEIKYENGECLNGKEYCDGKIMFEGIFQNGKRWTGKGKEYNDENIKMEKDGKEKEKNLC